MPLYALTCSQGCTTEEFCHHPDDKGCRLHVCEPHGEVMAYTLSVGAGLTYFESGRPRTITNLGHEPVVVTSHEQHKRLMREAGVEWATKGRGMKGSWH